MSRASEVLSPELHAYLLAHGTPPDEVLRDLADETDRIGDLARMQVAPEQGALLTMLVRLLGARLAVEVGTFTGYSALCIARGLADGGRLLCHDINVEWTDVARRYWQRAGVADRIELTLGPAADTLSQLPEEPVDFAFIDADKQGYIDYWEAIVPRLRPGGLVVVDNVLSHGRVLDPDAAGNPAHIRRFNEHVVGDGRVDLVMIPVADGLTLGRRR